MLPFLCRNFNVIKKLSQLIHKLSYDSHSQGHSGTFFQIEGLTYIGSGDAE